MGAHSLERASDDGERLGQYGERDGPECAERGGLRGFRESNPSDARGDDAREPARAGECLSLDQRGLRGRVERLRIPRGAPATIDGHAPFVIFALPRSRTYWLSKFLSAGEWHCGHDELRYCRSLDDAKAWLSQPYTGTVETAAAPWWRLLRAYAPNARVVTIRRPVEEVVASLLRIDGVVFEPSALTKRMRQLDAKLGQIEARVANCRSFRYEDMRRPNVCRDIFQFCLSGQGEPPIWDHRRWDGLATQNLQCSLPAMVRYIRANFEQLEKLAKTAKHVALSLVSRAAPNDIDGVEFQTEPFETWFSDAQSLFAAHLVQVGEAPDNFRRKNLPLMRELDRLGCMQIATARSNGRIFGYLMTVLSPSLEHENVLTSIHTTFFADPSFRGLGVKLQRFALEKLRERGVAEAYMRTGVRGDGPRMGSLYRRLGAAPDGELFKLDMGAA